MGLVVYLFLAVSFVLVVGWAVYVLPTPGPLGPATLAMGLLPVGVIMGSVAVAVICAWAVMHAIRLIVRRFRQ